MAIHKRDWLFVALIVIVLGFFIAITGEEKTTKVPKDDIHLKFHSMLKQEGKKATEKFCKECHNPEQIALSAEHPPPFRCLFCHKT